jgi:predicted transcriptional regulator
MPGSIIIKGKQARILMALRDTSKDWYVATLAKSAGATYVHTCNFVKECERLGITTGERHGKTKTIRLTSKGEQISAMLSSLYPLISEQPPQGAEKPENQEHVT